ncbi:hypothetical protein LTR28_013711 [Elasticomyces elasticus]|nr:hypothetical protein LTR28_013711 [Elasticomyces elasticus]
MDQYAPHLSANFEGYYSKFDFPSGAKLALIICTVPAAKRRPHMVSFTYAPHDMSKVYQKELFVDSLQFLPASTGDGFQLKVPGMGAVMCSADSTTEYNLENEHFSFHATTTNRVPWSEHSETPEALLVHLPLPLHWHVQSLGGGCKFTMDIPSHSNLPAADRSGVATVHQEKNWANSFPSAHIWLQARDGERGICCAGGQILGMEAYLLGYRNKQYEIDFRPPFAVRALGLAPFMSVAHSWADRTFELSVQTFRRKIVVKASAPKGTFFSLSSPFPDGHRENFLSESFQATLNVKVYESGWLSEWRLVHEDTFEEASLEFGGDYYPPAGTDQKLH